MADRRFPGKVYVSSFKHLADHLTGVDPFPAPELKKEVLVEVENEEFRDIEDYPGYQVSNLGSVKQLSFVNKVFYPTLNIHREHFYEEKFLKIQNKFQKDKLISVWVYLKRNGKIKAFPIHKLVLEAFVRKRPENMQCCHYDGNPKNNKLSNLRWDTAKSNYEDSIRHGTCFNVNRKKIEVEVLTPKDGDAYRKERDYWNSVDDY